MGVMGSMELVTGLMSAPLKCDATHCQNFFTALCAIKPSISFITTASK